MKRKVEALSTAIATYINEGTTIPPSHYSIDAGGDINCKSTYSTIEVQDNFGFEFRNDESRDWNELALQTIELIFDMRRFTV